MPNQLQKTTRKNAEELLNSNPKISRSIVSQYRDLEKQLKKLGVDTKSHYTLSPPLGGIVSNLQTK